MILGCVRPVLGFSIAALHHRRRALAFPSRTCLHLTTSRSFTMEILLSFCLRCLSRAANITLRLSSEEPRETFIQLFGFVFDNDVFKTLAFFPHLPNIYPRLSSFHGIFVYCLSVVFHAEKFPGIWPPFFESKTNT